MKVPKDMQKALDENLAAATYFNTLKSSNRYAFLYRIQTAKNAAARLVQIQKTVAMLEKRKIFHALLEKK